MEPQTSGLLLVAEKQEYTDISETERRMLYIAEKDYLADAVYFQKFQDKRAPVAQIFVYDNTKNKLTVEQKAEIHKRIWSSEIVPIYYLIDKAQLIVVNGRQKLFIDKDTGKENFEKTITEQLNLLKAAEKDFEDTVYPYKAHFFDNGAVWDTDTYKNKFISKESPFDLLIGALKDLRKALAPDFNDSLILNRLIVQLILIKYLEEKKDKDNNNVFTVGGINTFSENWSTENFVGTIEKGRILDLLDYLASQFNGKIFEWKSALERSLLKKLPKKVLSYISAYLNGSYNSKTQNFAIWRYYSFQYLPVELISRIYEEFLPNMPGVVYTPPFLVDFLIDQAMPIDDYQKFKHQTFKILDPSLGSGIFCVSAYKRLIDWYKINRYYEKSISFSEPVEPKILQSILKNNIFGTDTEPEAVRVAIFSLTLALLEKLTPVQIYSELKFDDLSKENILHENFFSFFNKHKDNPDFDLVIGNPPFNAPKGISNGKYLKKIKKDFEIEESHKIPDDNLALVFLDRATLLSKKETGLICLILPSAPLLYGKWSMDYRSHFLKTYYVPQIVDFTHLRRVLFNKDVASLAVFVKNQLPTLKENIWHIVANRTKKEQNRLFFVFDHYDFHIINYQRALNERYVWKTNLVGGGRLGRIIERLNNLSPKLGEYIESKRDEGWQYGEGYIKGKTEGKTKEQIENTYQKADWLFQKPIIKSKSLKEDGSFETEIDFSTEYFQAPRQENKEIFRSPHIIINKTLGTNNFPLTFINDDKALIFNNQFIGISSPNIDELEKIYALLKNKYSKTSRFFIAGTSYRLLIDKETSILKTDIDNLPYPEDEKELELSEIENIWQDDVLNYYIHQAKSPDNNPLNKVPEDIEKQIRDYGKVFCEVMNASYSAKDSFAFKQGRNVETNSYIATCFHYTDKDINPSFHRETETEFKEYFEKQTGTNQKITRIVKWYSFSEETGDSIWFIKPKQLRYWLKSIGDRDAFDVYGDILKNK